MASNGMLFVQSRTMLTEGRKTNARVTIGCSWEEVESGTFPGKVLSLGSTCMQAQRARDLNFLLTLILV